MTDQNQAQYLARLEACLHQYGPLREEGRTFARDHLSSIEALDDELRGRRDHIESLRNALRKLSDELTPSFPRLRTIGADETERQRATNILDLLVCYEPVETVHTIDFSLQLWHFYRLASEGEHEGIYYFLISIAGWDDSLVRENHKFGYHFHYVDTSGHPPKRTDVLLTFDCKERLGPPDTLFWEHHGKYTHADPRYWGAKRRAAVHTAARSSLHKPGKSTFLRPSKWAEVLCAR